MIYYVIKMTYHIMNEETHAVRTCALSTWIKFTGTSNKLVKTDLVKHYQVHTVFVGLNDDLFKTIVRNTKTSKEVKVVIYKTWVAAVAGHQKALTHVGNLLMYDTENILNK